MPYVTTADGADTFYKDWGPKAAQPIVFHHGWPLSSDDWDAQVLFFLGHGYRVVAHGRRGHGRSAQTVDGHDMDHYAADAAAVVEHLDLRDAIHVGPSTGGGIVGSFVPAVDRSSSVAEWTVRSCQRTNPSRYPPSIYPSRRHPKRNRRTAATCRRTVM